MRAFRLVDSLFALYSAGHSLPPISGGDGSGDPPPEPKPAPVVPPPATAAPDLGKLIEAAVAKHGDQTSALKAIISDNYALRDDLKAARAGLPKPGSRVIEGDDLKHFEAYKEFGTPSEVRKARDERDALAAKVAAHERQEVLRGVAEKAKVSYPVLARLAPDGLAFEPRTVKVQGKDTEVLHVKDGEAAPVPFDDYAAKHWAEFLPALKPDGFGAAPAKPNGTPNRQEFNPNLTRDRSTPPPPDAKARHLATIAGAY
jgi:hypothetical protein